MQQFPPMPAWEALHPLIIHFPIVLLLMSPLFIVVSAVLPPPRGRPYMMTAIFLLILGTASLFIATATGKAAARLVERGGGVDAVLETHQNFASETIIVFSELSIILLGIFLLPRILRRRETRLFSTVLPLTFLAFYFGGIVFLVNTAHTGSRLAYEFGVHALISATTGQSAASASPAEANNRISDDKH
ncbi:MAG TPA: DUF2231 domain-containing protein [Acidobacteriaceae bacterium]|nr:DUF2231 domain-containing protein [Acidobacteriaceae bacterium]